MALIFRCKTCGDYIVVRFLKVGEAAECKNCGASNTVPEAAESIDDETATSYQSRARRSATERAIVDANIPQKSTVSVASVRKANSEPESRSEKIRQQMEESQQKKIAGAQNIRLQEERIPAQTGYPIVVLILLVINTLVWIITEIAGGSTQIPILVRFGAQVNNAVIAGEYWRLISAMFLHIGFIHLLFNCIALFIFGRVIESMYGKYRFLVIYLFSGYFGNLLFLAFGSPGIVSAGASGAVFGIIGAHIPLNHQITENKLFADRQRAVAGIGYVLWIFFESAGEGVNILAHLGGVLAGVVLGFVLVPEYLQATSPDESEENQISENLAKLMSRSVIAGVILVGLTVACILGRSDMTTAYGKIRNFQETQLFYTSSVTESEVEKLGEYLANNGFADENPKTVQLNKSGYTYQFRMVVKEGFEHNPVCIAVSLQMAIELSSDVFDNASVEIHLCNNRLKTIKVVEP